MIKKIYLYRHGETNWNLLSRVMGQLENITTTFTPTGIMEIKEISQSLDKNSVEVIYCSDFSRAYETALIACKNNIPIIRTKELRGLNMGKYQGLVFEEYINAPEVKKAFCDYDIAIGGGESINDLNRRVENFILNVCRQTKYNSIGIITHSAVISNLKSYLMKEKYLSLCRCNIEYIDYGLKVTEYQDSEQSKIKLNNEFIFVRHGENICDKDLLNDDLYLSELGVNQAKKLSKSLNSNYDVIISSPSKRCIMTASILSQFNKKIILDKRLYERGWGGNKNGDETDFEAKERFLDFLLDVNEKYSNKKILIVTHGSLMKLIQDVIEQKCINRENVDNCTMIKYDKEKKKTLIR